LETEMPNFFKQFLKMCFQLSLIHPQAKPLL